MVAQKYEYKKGHSRDSNMQPFDYETSDIPLGQRYLLGFVGSIATHFDI